MKYILLIMISFLQLLSTAKENRKINSDIVILYASKHGTTEKVAHIIGDSLQTLGVSYVNLLEEKHFDISQSKCIIIGGSIHMGKIQKEVKKFCEKNQSILKDKKTALFLSCMETGEKAQEQFNNAYPEWLRNQSKAGVLSGYELIFEKMSFIERKMTTSITGVSQTVSKINYDAINKLVSEIRK
jgi:menaquinone-dependent protoporphyrinogen oxidase